MFLLSIHNITTKYTYICLILESKCFLSLTSKMRPHPPSKSWCHLSSSSSQSAAVFHLKTNFTTMQHASALDWPRLFFFQPLIDARFPHQFWLIKLDLDFRWLYYLVYYNRQERKKYCTPLSTISFYPGSKLMSQLGKENIIAEIAVGYRTSWVYWYT